MSANSLTFSELVHRVLVVEKRWPVEEVAEGMGMKYATFYARLNKRVPFNPEEIRALIAVAPDIRLVTHILHGSPFIAIDRFTCGETEEDGMEGPDGIYHAATRSVLEAADVLRAVEESLTDRKLDRRDRIRIEVELEEAERALASLRARLENMPG